MTHSTQAIAIVGSAGSFQIIHDLLSSLKAPYPLTLVICLHISVNSESALAAVLQNVTSVPVFEATDKAPLQQGHIYTAPAGYHLLVETSRIFSLSVDPPLNFQTRD